MDDIRTYINLVEGSLADFKYITRTFALPAFKNQKLYTLYYHDGRYDYNIFILAKSDAAALRLFKSKVAPEEIELWRDKEYSEYALGPKLEEIKIQSADDLKNLEDNHAVDSEDVTEFFKHVENTNKPYYVYDHGT